MADYQSLLDQYMNAYGAKTDPTPAAPAPTVTDAKMAAVSAASAQKQQALSGSDMYRVAVGAQSGQGAATAPAMEQDLRTLSYADLAAKYGPEQARQLQAARGSASQDVLLDQNARRTTGQAIGDVVTGVGLGAFNSLAGPAALGAGMLNRDAGVALSQAVDRANQVVQGNQSDGLNAKRRLYGAEQALDTRDNAAATQGDDLMSSLRRIGKDALSSVKNTLAHPELAGDVVASGVGSLVTAGPIGKGLQAVGVGARAAIPAAIALQEGGGAYQQTAAQVANMSFDELNQKSPSFREMVANGATPEEARTTLASRAGLLSAAVQAPIAAATGKLVAGFEGAPFKVPSLGQAAGNLARETVEEGIQSGTGQAAQNLGMRQVDPTQSLLEGVGEQIGQGALGGLGSAGATQAPGALRAGATGAVNAALGQIGKAADAVAAKNEASSPASTQAIQQQVAAVQAEAPQAQAAIQQAQAAVQAQVQPTTAPAQPAELKPVSATDESVPDAPAATPQEKADRFKAYTDQLQEAFGPVDPSVIQGLGLSPAVAEMVTAEGAKDAPTAMRAMANLVHDKTGAIGERDKTVMATALSRMVDLFDQISQMDPESRAELTNDHPASRYLKNYEQLVEKLNASPLMQQVKKTLLDQAARSFTDGSIEPITEQSLATPQGQQNAQMALAMIRVAPQAANVELVNQLLDAAKKGKLQLLPAQQAHLQTVQGMLATAQADAAERARLGMRPKDAVSGEIRTDSDTPEVGKTSLWDHANRIQAAYARGDKNEARNRLLDLMKFAQHMTNKVSTLNDLIDAGKTGKDNETQYKALHPSSKKWVQSVAKLWVDPAHTGSVALAQTINQDAQVVTNVANTMADAYPDLKINKVKPVALHGSLLKASAKHVSEAAKAEVRKSATLDDAAPKGQPAVKPAAKAEVKAEPAPVTEAASSAKDAGPKAEPVQPAAEPAVSKDSPKPAEPKVEKAAEPAVSKESTPVDTSAASVQAVDTKPKTVAERFSSLIGSYDQAKKGMKNWFVRSFRLPEHAISRTTEDASPLAMLRDAFKDKDSLAKLIGGEVKGAFNPQLAKGYAGLLGPLADSMKEDLNKQLQAFITKPMKGGSIIERLERGDDVVRLPNLKVLNLVEKQADGSYAYNQSLLENAVLAGIQWYLQSNDYGSIVDDEAAAAILGISRDEVTPEQLAALRVGMSDREATTSLAQKIQQYWGVVGDKTAPMGHVEGIPMSMAGEVLRSLESGGYVTQHNLEFEINGKPRKVNRIEPKTLAALENPDQQAKFEQTGNLKDKPRDSVLATSRNLIDQAVLTEPAQVMYFGDERPQVAKTQMRNPMVKNSPDQLKAIENEQNTPHFANLPMVGLYRSLGLDNLLNLFGGGVLDQDALNQRYNKNDLKTLEGKNRSIEDAFNQMNLVMAELESRASAAGVPADQMAMHYAYNFTKVGRLHMLGKYNPQSSKLMREAILPTRSTMDLSDPKGADFDAFMLGLGQALGVKVHTMDRAQNRAKTSAILDAMPETVSALRDWLQTHAEGKPADLSQDVVVTLKDEAKAAGADLNPWALHALTEYARMTLALENGTADKFTTSLYLEADGVTNGPINAMVLHTPGQFTQHWLDNVKKGGLFTEPGRTMNEFRQTAEGSVDLYKAGANGASALMGALRTKLAAGKDKKDVERLDHLLRLMDRFLGKDLSFRESVDPETGERTSTLTIERGLAKNPLTITVYGSGEQGIANKLVGQVTDAIYTKMSAAADAIHQGQFNNMAEALFAKEAGGDPDVANKMLAEFYQSLSVLTKPRAKKLPNGTWEQQVAEPIKLTDPVNFTLGPKALKALQSNMDRLFVSQLGQAIRSTVGEDLMGGVESIRKATQVQSIFLKHAFLALVQKTLAEKEKDPEYSKQDFLSRQELDKIVDQLAHFHPMIKTGSQDFYIAASLNTEATDENDTFGRALDGTFRTRAYVPGPDNSGVAGVATINIGTGDGQMMLTIASKKGGPEGTLKVFDGMNGKLTTVMEDGRAANQAVFESWQMNPTRSVAEAFKQFLSSANLDAPTASDDKATQDLLAELTDAFSGPGSAAKEGAMKWPEIVTAMKTMANKLHANADEVQARHQVLGRLNLSIDQMAAAGAPYQHEGGTSLTGSPEEQLRQLNDMYKEELAKVRKGSRAKSHKIEGALAAVGRPLPNGARVLEYRELQALAKRAGNIPTEHAQLLKEMLAHPEMQDYSVLVGSTEQVREVSEHFGVDPANIPDNVDRAGVTFPDEKLLVLHDLDSTVLVHEMIHATTFAMMDAYYSGRLEGEQHAAAREAMQRIELLMDQFRNMGADFFGTNPKLAEEHQHVVDVMDSLAHDPAMAANEFLAYALTTKRLIDAQKNTKANPLVRLVRGALAAIKRLVLRGSALSKPADDMFSNLVFNTKVLLRSAPTVGDQFRATAGLNALKYGNSDRLTEINNTIDQAVIRHLGQKNLGKKLDRDWDYAQALTKAISAASRVEPAFHMDGQQATTFRMLVTALATSIQLDPNALARMQELYTHVTKVLEPKHFRTNEDPLDQADEYQAQEKLKTILGENGLEKDQHGRSTLLPTFMALSIVHPDLRKVLATLPVPKNKLQTGDDFDATLQNVGNRILEELGQRLSGEGQQANIQAAMDALADRILDQVQEREGWVAQHLAPVGNAVDVANDRIAGMLQDLAAKTYDRLDRVGKASQNKIAKAVTELGKLAAATVNAEKASYMGEAALSWTNSLQGKQPVKDFITDLVGRIESNGPVYDLIKGVRADVQQDRQQYREHLPSLIADKFSRQLSEEEWTSLYRGLGQSDLASLVEHMDQADILKLFQDPKSLAREIQSLEKSIQQADPKAAKQLIEKSRQLAGFMMNKVPGHNLLRNATAIAHLLGEPAGVGRRADPQLIESIDQLVTLYALDSMSVADKTAMSLLVEKEADGIGFAVDYLVGQRAEEMRKVADAPLAQMNHFKGYIPSEPNTGSSLIVADDADHATLLAKSFVRVGEYKGSNLDRSKGTKGYYYAPVSGRAAYNQGIMQNVRLTAGGVDVVTGASQGLMTAGRITDPTIVAKIAKNLGKETPTSEPLLPIYGDNGLIVAFERSLDPNQTAQVAKSQHLAAMIGAWRGRQAEEFKAQMYNEVLVDRLYDMYQASTAAEKDQYVDLFDPVAVAKDPVLADAVKLFTPQVKDYIRGKFGDEFPVRKDLLLDVAGARSATVGDMWTGNSRWSLKVQEQVKQIAMGTFGNKAYQYLVNSEKIWQNYVTDARLLIVVKSVVVPMSNLIGNVFQLVSRGVPIAKIASGMPKKTAEIDAYLKSKLREIELEAELRATHGDVRRERQLKTEIQSIQDSHKRLSIWPLIAAGEFSAISDAGISRDEVLLSEGRLHAYMEKLANKLPGPLATAGRYALVSKDTALFQGLQKAVEYGDFLAKAVLYDHLTQKKGLDMKTALTQITEEYVNYDRLPGRFRGYLESMGLLWFYNFKIRSTKVALSMIRHNPLHALIGNMIPTPTWFGSVGTPLGDNFVTQLASGGLGHSIGLGQAFHAPMMNPLANLLH